MPVISTSDFKNGMTIILDGVLYDILEFQFVKPGKGGAFVRTRLRNVKTQQVLDHTFDSKARVEQAIVEKVVWEYLYQDGEAFVFMDNDTYEQTSIQREIVETMLPFLKDNTPCNFKVYEGQILSCSLPDFMELEVVETEPYVKGQTAAGTNKPAKVETGAMVQVPVFVTAGEKIRIDTRTGKYVERVSS
jgi:elongation factor P